MAQDLRPINSYPIEGGVREDISGQTRTISVRKLCVSSEDGHVVPNKTISDVGKSPE